MAQAGPVLDQGVAGSGAKVRVVDTGIGQAHSNIVENRLTGLQSSSANPWWRHAGHSCGAHVSGTIAVARNKVVALRHRTLRSAMVAKYIH
jgi:subtilisin family serine protease